MSGLTVSPGEVYSYDGASYEVIENHVTADEDAIRDEATLRANAISKSDLEDNSPPHSMYWQPWAGLKFEHVRNLEGYKTITRALDCSTYAKNITTDSQTLGPFINSRDFTLVRGCMALTWVRGQDVYVFRFGKEAVCAKVTWQWTKEVEGEAESKDKAVQMLTLVTSTKEILEKALNKLDPSITINVEYVDFPERHIFKLNYEGLLDEGVAKTYAAPIVDEFSSQTVS